MIELQKVSISVNGRTLLYPTNLAVPSGTFVAITGPNGAGKTTLLRVLSTIWRPTTGEIRIDGQRPTPSSRKQIGLVLQESMLYSGLTVHENLSFFGRLYNIANLNRTIQLLVKDLKLTPFLHKSIAHLSKGYVQRVAIARALLHNPCYLLLDEPFDGLDQECRAIITQLIHKRVNAGLSVVVVTHDFDFANDADVRISVDRGKIAIQQPYLARKSLSERGSTEVI